MICERTRSNSRLVNANGPSKLVPSVISNPSTVSLRCSVSAPALLIRMSTSPSSSPGNARTDDRSARSSLSTSVDAADLRGTLGAQIRVAHRHDDVRPRFRQGLRGAQPHPVGGAGHDDPLAAQIAEATRRPLCHGDQTNQVRRNGAVAGVGSATMTPDMSDSAREIKNLIYTYAERLDAGDLDGVAELFAHGRICGMEDGPPETVFAGPARVRQMYEMATRLYEDGTPKTKHNTSNVQLDIDEDAGTARSSVLLLRHAGDAGPAAADHRDRPLPRHVSPHRRRVVVRHPHHVRRPGRRHQPPPEVLTGVAQPSTSARLLAACAAEGRRSPTGGRCAFEEPLAVLAGRATRRPTSTTIGVHILRSGIVHSLRMRLRAQEWIRRHPGDPRGDASSRRSWSSA